MSDLNNANSKLVVSLDGDELKTLIVDAVKQAFREAILEDVSLIPSQKTGEPIVGVKSIAGFMHVSTSTINRLLASGKLDGIACKVGKTVVVRDSARLWQMFEYNKKLNLNIE